jgi:hypothetical protein
MNPFIYQAINAPSKQFHGEDNGIRLRQVVEEEPLTLQSSDILMGRGSGPSNHPGNIRLRDLVWKTYQEHLSPESEHPATTRTKVVNIVFNSIKAEKRRFLRKITKPKQQNQEIHLVSATTYCEVSDKEALEKTKQTLRFQIERREEQQSTSNGPPSPHTSPAPHEKTTQMLSSASSISPATRKRAANPSNLIDDELLRVVSHNRFVNSRFHHEQTYSAAQNNVSGTPRREETRQAGPLNLSLLPPSPLLSPNMLETMLLRRQVFSPKFTEEAPKAPAVVVSNGPGFFDAPTALLSLQQLQVSPLRRASPLTSPSLSSRMSMIDTMKSLKTRADFSKPDLSAGLVRFDGEQSLFNSDLETLIRREELHLALEKIRTRRLTAFIRTSFLSRP